MKSTPLKKRGIMNVKRYLGASLAFFVFMFFYDWLVHGVLLMKIYEQTAQIWRTEQEMHAHMPLGFLCHILTAAWLGLAFTQFYKNGGTKNGVTFGVFFGGILGLAAACAYIWLPIPAALAWYWFFANFFKYLLGGYILGAIYRKKA
jgi:hypothetical protein